MDYPVGFYPHASVTGPELKIDRAHYHIELLGREIRKFFQEYYSDVLAVYCDVETRDKVWVIAEEPVPPPLYLSTIIGDALYNLRSALDHLVHELIRANGKQPNGRSAFPIVSTSEVDYDRVAPVQVQGMDPDAAAAIKRLQPYNRAHRHRDKWLRLLNHLGNIDKHRHLHLVVPASGGWMFTQSISMGSRHAIHAGVLKLGTEIARVSEQEMDVDGGFFGEVAFSDAEAFHETAYYLLIGMREFVKTIVAEFRRDFINVPLASQAPPTQ